ncbi:MULTISPECIES: HAD family phosphatase [Streptomyces]|uniref:HAD family phosphatase n=1 Tax=Streptomyces lichenis TaxID=2306967 RepID=A0ABT0IB47_9ACTN|nr:HAD family phosphatase [Streptomyces lichenis]MCK8678520.1 HAD family phosphatase [Streptomyces lichenis]
MTTQAHPLLGWSPEAVVLDCDGTLMDSERHWQDARNRAFREFGLTSPPGFADRAKGVHYADCGRLMAEETHKPDLADDLARSLLEHFLRLVADNPATMPGAVEFVRLLAGRLPLAVASNCPLEVVEESLGRAGLLRHFAHVVVPTQAPGSSPSQAVPDGSDAAVPGAVRPKPWPDVYAMAARLCSTEPERALAVEDSLTGIEAARRAGLRVLGVGPRPSEEDASRADLWVAALHSPVLLAWARKLGPRQADAPKK